MLGTVAATTLVTTVMPAAASQRHASSTFLLIHGAWHGGWCWKKVLPLLRVAGFDAYAPTLTGLGERSHLLAPTVDLETHVNDVAAVIEYEDLTNVILVGHSYAGMLIARVAEQASPRIAHLVYLDAFLPEDGKAVRDYAPVPPARDDGWRIPPPGSPPRFDVAQPADVAWMEDRLGDQPLRTFTDAVRLSAADDESLQRTYIQCTRAPWFAEAADRAKQHGFRSRELPLAGHDAMITRPDELASILLELP